MNIRPARIFPLGDNALTVEFGNEISVELNDAALSLANHVNAHPFPGLVEAVPAMASTTVFYNAYAVSLNNTSGGETAFAAIERQIREAIENISIHERSAGRLVRVPVSFEPEDALDLAAIAKHSGLDKSEVLEVFLSREYRVFMVGFLPGFPYMGIVDDRIAVPRRATPRVFVPKGSVGIAGRQTGIYPSGSPGGWQVIGRTDIELFDADGDAPCLFTPGDRVRFERT